ncbi:MAG TPA: malectin domain-containing carbohydrate-binding protein [Phycisphaerae bacterium]|nr:malectin domain-containing carbohydrate-binding protein [Phycisphaerae bacterium]HRR85270.1 malectin domain-containing carbohydrate-binding protein [Phycisphaerae bacterium]
MNLLCAGTLSKGSLRVQTCPRHFARALGIVLASLLAGSSAASAQPTESRLGLHMIINYTSGASQVVNAHPRIHKILDTHGAMLASARDFKNNNPNGVLVLRIYTTKSYNISHDPAWAATDFWNTVLAPPINSLSAQDRALIDYVEGPNECDSTPCWGSIQNAQWLNNFWLSLAPLIANAGFRPCAFCIPVGNPPGSLSDMQAQLDAVVPALRVCKSYNGGWSYHAYTLPYSKSVSTEIWYSLRYRQFYSYFRSTYPDLADLPLLLTEGGVDGQSGEGGPGWKVDDAARYVDWLTWFDARMKEDPYVVGCTLFQSGDLSGWFSFDTEEINPWLAQHILSSVPPTPPAVPANLNAAINGPTSVQLTWSSASGAISYNVKRSMTGGDSYSTIGTSTTLSYTDNDLTLGATYHYVVSAVNNVGESANSNESTITVTGGYAANSGGSSAGRFAADTCYDGGYTYMTSASVDTTGATDPAPQAVYQSERWASPSFTYTFPNLVAGAEYTVRLHFAEIYFTSAGKRRFNVSINGAQVLTNFDIIGTAGAANKAVVHTFTTNANPSGQVIIQYSAGSADNPKAGGIEIIRNLPPVYMGDFDQDLDVDQRDFGLLQACLSGNGITQNDPSCTAADLDGDADVDLADFGVFLNCLSGERVMPPESCRT